MHQRIGQDSGGDQPLRSVDIAQEQIDQLHALLESVGDHGPFARRDHERDRIQFPRLRDPRFDQLARRRRRVVPQVLLGGPPTKVDFRPRERSIQP